MRTTTLLFSLFFVALAAIGEQPCANLDIEVVSQKPTYLLGEPILIQGKFTNRGSEAVGIDTGIDGMTPHDNGPGRVHAASLVLSVRSPSGAWSTVEPESRKDGLSVGGPAELAAGARIPFSFLLDEFFPILDEGTIELKVTASREGLYLERVLQCSGEQPAGATTFEMVKGQPEELRTTIGALVDGALAGTFDDQRRILSFLKREGSPESRAHIARLLRESSSSSIRRGAISALGRVRTMETVLVLEEVLCGNPRAIRKEIEQALHLIATYGESDEVRVRAERASKLETCEELSAGQS